MTQETQYGTWEVIERLAEGGQGEVFLVRDTSQFEDTHTKVSRLRKQIDALVRSTSIRASKAEAEFVSEIRRLAVESHGQLGALKKLHPLDESAVSDKRKALGRMKSELEALKSISHPSLVRILDDNFHEQWFVMEYHSRGTLTKNMKKYTGRVLTSLHDIRPVVDAVYRLHLKGIVHRDIKPDNIFLSDGGSLVLGDCGLAFRMEREDRLTETLENVGSRDFQPPWSQGMRIDEVTPTFDVVTLGKTLWSMISGSPKPSLWYCYKDSDDLRRCVDDSAAVYAHEILKKCVVPYEKNVELCDAGHFLKEIDAAIGAISTGREILRAGVELKCQICAHGTYKHAREIGQPNYSVIFQYTSAYTVHSYICDTCGHLNSFAWFRDRDPPSWLEGDDNV